MKRKEERIKQGQTNNKAKQHSTPKAVTFPKKNELPRVGHVHVHVHVHIHVQSSSAFIMQCSTTTCIYK